MLQVVIVLLILVLLLCGQASAFSDKDFIISFWCAPPVSETTDERYAEIKNAGFNVVMPPCDEYSIEANRKILDLCRKHGMKAVVADPRIMAKQPGDPDFEKNLDAVIADYSSHPALYGYFITDEPNSGAFPQLAAITQYLLKKDPEHLPFINLLPTYASPEQLGNKTYEEHVNQYMQIVKNPLLSYDHYLQMTNFDGSGYFTNLEIIRRQAISFNVPFVNIILSTPHNPYRNPTMDDLRWQVYTTLAYGAHGVLYFTYWTPVSTVWNFHNGIVESNGQKTEHYDQVRTLNLQMAELSKTLVKLESKGVYHTGSVPPEAKPLPENWLVRKVKDANLVIGHFQDTRKGQYLMFVNKDMRKPAKAVVEMDPQSLPLKRIGGSGTSRYDLLPIHTPDYTVHIDLEPGEGKLYKIDRWNGSPPWLTNPKPTPKQMPYHPNHQAQPQAP